MNHSQAIHEFHQAIDGFRNHHLQDDVPEKIDAASVIYIMGPSSFLGQSFATPISQRLLAAGKQVILIDDTIPPGASSIPGCLVQGSAAFATGRPTGALAINMANTLFAHGFFSSIALRAGVPEIDIIPVLHLFDIPVIYQTASHMRDATLQHLDDYLALAQQLHDPLSIRTLAACIQMRLTMDRAAVLPILCSLEDEYFSPYPPGKDVTFSLRQDEIFCDIGAHVGTTVQKFLTATRWKYQAIHAFEPDSGNFSALGKGIFNGLANFHPRNIALSSVRGTLGFSETGTMGSRLDSSGNMQVQASTLDEEVSHATFIKMDVEGHERKILEGAKNLISNSKPRMAITGYHFADDLLDIAQFIESMDLGYQLRLRHHSFYYYDTILYASIPR